MALSAALQELIANKKKSMARNNDRAATLKEGKSRIRILPGWRNRKLEETGDPIFYHDFGAHWIKDNTGKIQAVVGCYGVTYEKPCSICDALHNAAKGTTDDAIIKIVNEAKAKHRILVNALILSSDKPTTPVVLELAKTAFEDILTIMQEYADTHGNMLDLKTGTDFVITRTGKGMDTDYTALPAAKSEPVDPVVMTTLTDLDAWVANEFESKKAKALNAISHVTGAPAMISPSASRLLSGPASVVVPGASFETAPPKTIEGVSSRVLDDSLPHDLNTPGVKTPAASAPAQAPATVSAPAAVAPVAAAPAITDNNFGSPIAGDDEIARMLDSLDLK